MIYNSYIIYDKINEEYGLCFFNTKDILAIRMYQEEFLTKKKHPEDFELFKNGTYDSLKGHFYGSTPHQEWDSEHNMKALTKEEFEKEKRKGVKNGKTNNDKH